MSLVVCDIGSKSRILECLCLPECSSGIQYPGARVAVAIVMSGEGPGLIRTQPQDSSSHHMKPPFTAKDTFQDSTNTQTHTHTVTEVCNTHSCFCIHSK